jgi:transporter family protein
MKPQILALVAAAAWGVGGYFEKKGLQMGNLFPQWRALPQAGAKPLVMMGLGGGVLAGAVGMLCFYAALKGAPLGRVMPIAFTSPLFGVIMGVWLGGESLSARELIGMIMATGGIVILTVR